MFLPQTSLTPRNFTGRPFSRCIHFQRRLNPFYTHPLLFLHKDSLYNNSFRGITSFDGPSHIQVHRGTEVYPVESSESENQVLEKIADALLENSLSDGCRSWDEIILKLLTATVVATVATARGGTLPEIYRKASSLRFQDIKLKLEPQDSARKCSVQGLHAEITLPLDSKDV
jgi:hypothetical protein